MHMKDDSGGKPWGGGLRRRARFHAGYSVIELLIVVAIVGVLVSIAIPNIVSAQQGYQLSTGTANVSNLLAQAKTEALKRNREIVVTFDSTIGSLQSTVGVGGALVGGPDYLPSGVAFDLGGAATLVITFDSMGRPLNPPQSLMVRHPDAGLVRTITVQSTGRVSVQ